MIAHNQQSCLVEITLLVNEPTTDSSSLLDNVPKKCGIQKRMTLLNICYKTKSQQTLINIYQWTLHTFILFRLDIPQSVVTYTYTSNIFFLELSVLVTHQHIEIPFFIVLFFVGNNQINTLVLQLLYLQSVQIWFGIAEISISMTAVCIKLNFRIKWIKKLQNSL